MPELEAIAVRILRYRKQNHVSQERFAARCRLALSAMRKIEHAQGNPQIDTLERIADQMGIDLCELLSVEEWERT